MMRLGSSKLGYDNLGSHISILPNFLVYELNTALAYEIKKKEAIELLTLINQELKEKYRFTW